jgi:hypothetical protein
MNFKRVAGSGRRVRDIRSRSLLLKEASDRYSVQPLNDEAQGWSALLSDGREDRDAPEGSFPERKARRPLASSRSAPLTGVGKDRHQRLLGRRPCPPAASLRSALTQMSSALARRPSRSALDEHLVCRYLRHRARKRSIQRGDRTALKRRLLMLRDAGEIAPPASSPITPQD